MRVDIWYARLQVVCALLIPPSSSNSHASARLPSLKGQEGRFPGLGAAFIVKREPVHHIEAEAPPRSKNSSGREVRRFHQSEALKRMAEGFIPSALAMRSTLRNVTLRSPRSIFPKWDRSMPDISASASWETFCPVRQSRIANPNCLRCPSLSCSPETRAIPS